MHNLSEKQLADLRASGLTDETITAAKLKTEDNPSVLDQYLGRTDSKRFGPCLVFPYLDRDGDLLGYNRVKPDNPRQSNGKPVKYESPAERPNELYIPPGVGPILRDPSKPLVITEGEKKALCSTQNGFPAVGLVGVWGWQKKREEAPDGKKTGHRLHICELEQTEWKGRTVLIVFDSDAARNEKVQYAASELAAALKPKGAKVEIVRLPDEPDGGKNGLDDFLVRYGVDRFGALLTGKKEALHAVDDPGRLARGYLDTRRTLRHYRGEFI